MPSPIVETRDFSFSFGREPVLRDVSFTVQEGEVVSIVGPNGAGKSTLLKCLDRILPGGTGSISLKGRPLHDYSQKELAALISYVPQADARALPFTVMEFVLMARYPHLSPFTSVKPADHAAAREALVVTGTEGFADRFLGTLSGGERQKVFIAAAIAQGAEVLLLDEPTTFLDPRHQDDIHRTLRRINAESGATIISVTHDINTAALFSGRVLALKAGAVAFCGPAAEIMDNSVLERIFGKRFIFAAHPVSGRRLVVPEEVV